MCGITGYVGRQNATEILIEGLRRLEYRGYDSAGVAVLDGKEFHIVRAEGKLRNLDEKIRKEPIKGTVGIGHTRWATHGRPSETNAHPHRVGPVVLVHNGIIENHDRLRKALIEKGHAIKSETDTEIVCHLIQQRILDGLPMREAFKKTLTKIEGSYALAVMNQAEPDRIYIARKGSPLVIGLGDGENFIASDVSPLLAYTRRVAFLEDGDAGVLSCDGVDLWDVEGRPVTRPSRQITWNRSMAEKGGYKHFMLKEIFEQPRAIVDTLSGRIADGHHKVLLNGAEEFLDKISFDGITILACGTSYHAGLVGKYWIEEMARIPVTVDLASEFRYRNPIIDAKTLIVAISQSGETADTLAAMTDAKGKGAKILSICNVIDSSIPRISDQTIYTRAGPEIGVASTKAFTTQLVVLLLVALHLGQVRKTLTKKFMGEALNQLVRVPDEMGRILKNSKKVAEIADHYLAATDFLYFARGITYPIALEGALKLKEISYVHAEGYAAGEMKHGPIALIDSKMPVVVLAPKDKTYEKVLSNIEEVIARGAKVIGVGVDGDEDLRTKCREIMTIPEAPWYINPLLMTIPLQLLAYYIADQKGTDVDQPRNLAKSVTVE